jgi:hypothetical protein
MRWKEHATCKGHKINSKYKSIKPLYNGLGVDHIIILKVKIESSMNIELAEVGLQYHALLRKVMFP